MPTVVWIILAIFGVIIALLVVAGIVLALLGKRIPAEHTARSAIDLAKPAAQVFQLIEDISGYPRWAPGVTKIEMLPDRNGLQVCRMRMGRNSFVLTRTRYEPPRLERTIQDDRRMFSGTWAYTVEEQDQDHCQLRLTETGRVPSAIPRACMKYFFGYHLYINKHLAGVSKALGLNAAPRKA